MTTIETETLIAENESLRDEVARLKEELEKYRFVADRQAAVIRDLRRRAEPESKLPYGGMW